ncbi:MAG: hypothetical protein AAF585_03055 [Verrucomicrobiota bacterium]
MKSAFLSVLLFTFAIGAVEAQQDRQMLVVIGAPGDDEFVDGFNQSAAQWAAAAAAGDMGIKRAANREALQKEIEATIALEPAEWWIVLIGHGTYDGRVAKFNLKGPDVSAEEIKEWLAPFEKNLVFINTASASAPFVPAIAGEKRVVISATKSGFELNVSHFGGFLAAALQTKAADLNKDEQVSILEAFLLAASETAEFFEKEGRLATEHALIDDNGDGRGTRGDWFEGLRVVRKTSDDAEPDGLWARSLHLIPNDLDRALGAEVRTRRNELEREVELLRNKRAEMGDEAYYARLEEIFLEIARIYQNASDS